MMPMPLRSKHLENFSVKTSFRTLSILGPGNEKTLKKKTFTDWLLVPPMDDMQRKLLQIPQN